MDHHSDAARSSIAHQSSSLIAKTSSTPWRERPLLPMQLASEVAGVSVASLYRLAAKGRVELKSLAGRTLVETASLIAMIERVEPWSPSQRAAKATAARADRSEAA